MRDKETATVTTPCERCADIGGVKCLACCITELGVRR